jgi:outer membrane protein TolC
VERDLEALRATALGARPELSQAGRTADAARSQAEVARAARLPSLALAVDGGTQGERYEFGSGSNFATLSLLLKWTLFDGGARAADERAARLAERQARNRRDELEQQVQLEVQTALDRLTASEKSLRAAEARAEAARAAFRISGRKRDEGMISQVEFLDARTSLTAAELNLNAVRFQLLARQADLDYATGAPAP